MPGLLNRLVAQVPPWSLVALAAALPLAHATPARAQDLFALLRLLSPPRPAPQPAPAPVAAEAIAEAPPAPQTPKPAPKLRPRPTPVRLAAPAAKTRSKPKAVAVAVAVATELPRPRMPSKAKPEGDIANPVPALLADGTLRSGDLAMFPTDLRVFTGRPGTRHGLSDFSPLPRAGKTLAPATQRLAAGLRPGWNAAWDAEAAGAVGKLAAVRADAARTVGKLAVALKEAETTQGSNRKAEPSGPLILRGCPGRAAQAATPPHPQEKLLILCVPEPNGTDIVPPPSTRALLPDAPPGHLDLPLPATIALEPACPPLASCDVDEAVSDLQTSWSI